MTTATRNFHRAARVSLNGTVIAECMPPPINGHRITFNVHRTHRSEPSTATVQIYGLAPELRLAISRAFDAARAEVFARGDTNQGVIKDLKLEIGYDGMLSTLIEADIVDIDHDDLDVGVVTTITAQDGGAPWRGSTVNETLFGGASIDLVMTAITQAMKIAFLDADSEKVYREALSGFSSKPVQGGFVLQGPIAKVATELFESMGIKFSYQNGKVQLVRFDHAKNDVAVVLSPKTGLLRRPKFRRLGRVTLHSQANPLLEPWRQIHLFDDNDAPQGAGLFRVDSAESVGDTFGGPWETLVEASPTMKVQA